MSQNNETFKLKNLTEAENRKLNNLLNKNETELTNADQTMIIKLFEKSGEFDTKTLDNIKDDVEGFTDIIESQDVRSGTPPLSSSSSISDGARRNAKPTRTLSSRSKNNKDLAVLIAGDDLELIAEVNKAKRITQQFIDRLTKKRLELNKAKRVAELQKNKGSTSSSRRGTKTTMNNNKKVKQNIGMLAKSEGEKEQIEQTVSKRKKTENQQKFLNQVGDRLTIKPGGGGGGAPKPERRPAPPVKLRNINKENEPLPEMIFPSTTIVLAKKFSGKTNLLLNIVDKSQFDNVWIVSLTGFTGKLDSLCEDSDCLLEDVSDTMINELLKLHKEDKMKSLIVFDDVIGQVDMRSKGMQKLATMGRNFGISIIISAQDFFKVPPIWRRNSEYWYIGNLTDSNIEAVAKELSVPSFQKRRIRQELGEIARDKNHDWLYYDDRSTRFRKLFGTQFNIIV